MVRALAASGTNDGAVVSTPNRKRLVGSRLFCHERLIGENMAQRRRDSEENPRPALERVRFKTPRNFDFFSEESLTKQIGHNRKDWPIALLKELRQSRPAPSGSA